jgi:predicted dehydrogenase
MEKIGMTVRVGVVGLGFMGVTHYRAYKGIADAQVVAVADTDEARRKGDWSKVGGNFGAGSGQEDLSGIKTYAAMEDLFADPEIDLVDVCLPTEFHPPAAIAALEAGKNVLVEKPIALTLQDADNMLAAAKKADRLFMVGQVLRFFPAFGLIKDAVEDGRYGALKALHMRRIISFPSWMAHPERIGGAAIDLHIHDTDFIRHLLGDPAGVRSTGMVGSSGLVDYLVTEYLYPDTGKVVTAQSGWIAHRSFEHGYDAIFEKGTLQLNSAFSEDVIFHGTDGKEQKIELPAGDPFQTELSHAVAAVARNEIDPVIAAQSARDSLAWVLAEVSSVKQGAAVMRA